MSLENLKSVFSNGAGTNNSEISGRYEQDSAIEPMESNFGQRTSAVNFFSGENTYYPTINPDLNNTRLI